MSGIMEDCEICGQSKNNPDGHDHSGQAIYIRDGSRGIHLVPTFIEDACQILGRELPVLRVQHEDDDGDGWDEQVELANRLEMELPEGVKVLWEDGYVIYDMREEGMTLQAVSVGMAEIRVLGDGVILG